MTLDFTFSDEQEKFREELREFLSKEIEPRASYWDQTEEYPMESLRKLGERRYLGLLIPKEFGGLGADYVTTGIFAEEIGRADMNTATPALIHLVATHCIANFGSEDMKRKWLPKAARGEVIVGIAETEPHTGSDAAAITTSASRERDYYVLNGEKQCVTSAGPGGAHLFLTFVVTKPGAGWRGISCLLLEADSPGVERYAFHTMGVRGTKFGGFKLNNVKVLVENLVGRENEGFPMMMGIFDILRNYAALSTVGAAEKALELAIERAKSRILFGWPLGKFEDIQFRIAEDYTLLQAAKLLAYRALWKANRGEYIALDTAMAKWFCVEAALKAADDAIQIHGAIGYTSEFPVERIYRDVRGINFGDGTPQIMKIIIGRELLGREYLAYRWEKKQESAKRL